MQVLQLDHTLSTTNKKVLCLGIGGGCDVVVAYSVAKLVEELNPESEVVWGNCCGPRSKAGLMELSANICCMMGDEPVACSFGENTYGTTKIEQSLPRGPMNCPLVIFTADAKGKTPEELTRDNLQMLVPQIDALGFDVIFAVDAGGDSLTGGVDYKVDASMGRDRQMLAVVSACKVKFVHLVFGPCCDGESSEEQMMQVIDQLEKNGQLIEIFDVKPCLQYFEQLSKNFEPTRTPNIMLSATRDELEVDERTQKCIVPRNLKPLISKQLLTSVYAFSWPENLQPSLPQLSL